MRARLTISYVGLVAVALALFTIPVAISSARLLRSTLERNAQREGQLFVPLLQRTDAQAQISINDRTRDFQRATGWRVRLVRASDPPPRDPQLRAALQGREPKPVWAESSLLGGRSAVSVAVPVLRGTQAIAAVQIVAPTSEVDGQIRDIWVFRIGVGLLVLLAAGLLAILLATSVIRPLRRLNVVARRLGQGDWSARAPEVGPPEVLELARTLNQSAATTAALLASQRSFVADASHQLRTPLTSIRLSLDNLADTTEDPAALRQLARVDAEITRMRRMVESLLALARAESPGAARQQLDVGALLADRLEVWQPALADAGIEPELQVSPAAEPCVVRATPGALEQVLDNLIDNAIGVSPAGSQLRLSARREGGRVLIVVEDDGPGLRAEQRERAFDRFWRARPAGTGSGLGLAIVRRLVEQDGGCARLAEAASGGLRVELELPAAGASPSLDRALPKS